MNGHGLGTLDSLHLGQVTDNGDPESRGRIKVKLLAAPLEVWAAVVAPSAGQGYGASFVPKQNEIVVLAFATPDLPLVLGSLWAGNSSVPSEASPEEDHYVIRTPGGAVLDFDDSSGGPRITIETSSGNKITITESGGGEVKLEAGSQSVTLKSSGIDIQSSGQVNINASTVNVSAGMVKVDAGMSKFSGVVKSDTVITNAVVSSSYTPGAGNVW
jgi:uncharacterized protein involved in type VI secretion and phage assembly